MLLAKTDKLLPLVSLSQDKSSGNNIPMITELGKNGSVQVPLFVSVSMTYERFCSMLGITCASVSVQKGPGSQMNFLP